jgi:hypothetical protein
MTNPHFTNAIAETRRAELYHEASQHRLAAEAGRQSLWSRLTARRTDRQPTTVARPATAG